MNKKLLAPTAIHTLALACAGMSPHAYAGGEQSLETVVITGGTSSPVGVADSATPAP